MVGSDFFDEIEISTFMSSFSWNHLNVHESKIVLQVHNFCAVVLILVLIKDTLKAYFC